MSNTVHALTASGSANVHIGDRNYYRHGDDHCLSDLRTTDPRDDKRRIEDTKGGLLKDSYRWILNHEDFRHWRDDQHSNLLWIKGHPGKGKTMLFCGLINELGPTTRLEDQEAKTVLSYFFCQSANSRINSATAVLRGLIYLLVMQQASLASHVQKRYRNVGKQLFEDENAWMALSDIFNDVLSDSSLERIYIMIDALDECVVGLPHLLNLIVRSTSSRVKWIVTSRNWPGIAERLDHATRGASLRLELNQASISAAVDSYIQNRVEELAALRKYSDRTKEAVRDYLSSNANDTFLWVALACQNIEECSRRTVLSALKALPPGLDSLYEKMVDRIRRLNEADAELCYGILAVVTVVYRPLTLVELASLVQPPEEEPGDEELLEEDIERCGSFLTVRDGIIYFVHQSARDYLRDKAAPAVFPSRLAVAHRGVFRQSLVAMRKCLRRDTYNLGHPGILIDDIQAPFPDPLAPVRYSCVYWVDHICEAEPGDDLFDEDARQFILRNGPLLKDAPLQTYVTALLFTPTSSMIREWFKKEEPRWVTVKPEVYKVWVPLVATLEHIDPIWAISLSPDTKLLASGSYDGTIKIWNMGTYEVQKMLRGHNGVVRSIAFSPDGKLLISGSYDRTVKIWDVTTGDFKQTFDEGDGGDDGMVRSVTFSPDGKLVASGTGHSIRVQDATTGKLGQLIGNHDDRVRSVAFSPDGQLAASGSLDESVKIWDVATGTLKQILRGHEGGVGSVVFSTDGSLIASGSEDQTIKIWDVSSGKAMRTLRGHTDSVWSTVFSADSKLLASGSDDMTVKIWDATTGEVKQTFKGHGLSVRSVAFSIDGRLLASGSDDRTVRIWDATINKDQWKLGGHGKQVTSMAFSPDRKLMASGSYDQTVKIWDTATGEVKHTCKGHAEFITSVAFSADNMLVASGSYDKAVIIWNAGTGKRLAMLTGHRVAVESVAFSRDNKLVASGSVDDTIKIWDAVTGHVRKTLKGHSRSIRSVAFSNNGRLLVSGSNDKTVRIWDITAGTTLQTLIGHGHRVRSVTFSNDDKLILSGSDDGTIRVWDNGTGKVIKTLEGHYCRAPLVSLSPENTPIGYGMNFDGSWITFWDGWERRNLLNLPPEFRPSASAASGSTLAIGCPSGRVLFFTFTSQYL
ncbi:wd40 repeat protein [Fusarium pseudoanthophilum]|uniref:Wd40 repeat protein n=1 Tax=Fusarium pseudoanthophilum TaxID=48495 RepID=A0A8H5KUV0_9HYPO|nr:wd40 repeat protein [Fusarium pseudoanthophilum]